jgi:hypothetical protein
LSTRSVRVYVASVLFGLCTGNVVILPSLVFQHECPKELFGRVLGSSTAVGQISYALVPSVLGGVRDLVGIKAVLDVCIGLQLLAATLMALSALEKREPR